MELTKTELDERIQASEKGANIVVSTNKDHWGALGYNLRRHITVLVNAGVVVPLLRRSPAGHFDMILQKL